MAGDPRGYAQRWTFGVPSWRNASYLTDTTDALRQLIRDIKAGKADHLLAYWAHRPTAGQIADIHTEKLIMRSLLPRQ